MEVTRTWIDDTADPGLIRSCAEIRYDDRRSQPEIYWIGVPRERRDEISATGNPWLVALLPLAVTLGEPLVVPQPVDPVLFRNLQRLLSVWRLWYPHLPTIRVDANMQADSGSLAPRNVAAFFSGGVDSFYTLLREREDPADPPINDLIAVWGFDVPLPNVDAFERMRGALQRVADDSATTLVAAATNLRQTRWAAANWGRLAHGCGLVSVALTLERRWRRVLIASSYDYAHLHPFGTHPLTDPLLSTAQTQIVHDGAGANRVDKTRLVAASPLARRSLRVCWRSRSDTNCGACEKCYRTMTTLWLLGTLDRCTTFPPRSFDPARIEWMFCANAAAAAFLVEIRALAVSSGRPDVVASIDRALKRSRRLVRADAALKRLGAAVDRHALLRPAAPLLQRIEWRMFRHALR